MGHLSTFVIGILNVRMTCVYSRFHMVCAKSANHLPEQSVSYNVC
uniref:Uncharacterized protein n=1 Tax=Anguilla anguilla TaxID=7936 RepID=A0A0E9VBI8_ANGAN